MEGIENANLFLRPFISRTKKGGRLIHFPTIFFFQDNSGSLSVEEFMTLPELQQNPLVQRVIDIFDEDGNGEVDFKEFIQGVSQFSVKGDKTSKLRFAFR